MSKPIDLGAITAYGIAKDHGFQGTEEEWLDSLKGEKGDPATDAQVTEAVNSYIEANPDTIVPDGSISEAKLGQEVKDRFSSLSEEIANLGDGTGTGAPGPAGADGKSAYQYAQEGGYTGTEAEFAAKLAEEIPDKLPNPNALTFTGAVTGSYDGAAPLEVAIPSGGGGLTVTNTAAVGQTVKIAAVDENGQPTEWEAVDFSSGGDAEKRVRHIATVSVTAGTTSYSVTVDSNGDALNLESVYILTENFWGNNGSYVQVKINGKDITRAHGASGSPQALALEKMGELQKFTKIDKPSDVRISFGDYYNGKSAVTSVGFWSVASTVDTTIEIYGVDA